MKSIIRYFIQGLAVVIPMAVTVYIIYWLGTNAESAARQGLRGLFTEETYIPGMGILVGVLIILAIGILTELWVIRKLIGLAEGLLMKIPLVKTIFGGLRDLMGFLSSVSKKGETGKVVMVTVAEGVRILGLVTREDGASLPAGMGDKESVAVYLPMSYQLGGFTLAFPRTAVEPVDLPAEDAMRLALTAWMSTEKDGPRKE